MKDGSDDTKIDWRLYEDLSSYEDEDEAPVLPPTKIQAALRPAAKKLAGRKSRPTKTAPEDIPSGLWSLVHFFSTTCIPDPA